LKNSHARILRKRGIFARKRSIFILILILESNKIVLITEFIYDKFEIFIFFVIIC
jgi:hypothetical protein